MGPNIHVDVTWRTLPTQAQVHLPMTVALPHGCAPPAGQFALPHCKNCSGKKGQGITLASEFFVKHAGTIPIHGSLNCGSDLALTSRVPWSLPPRHRQSILWGLCTSRWHRWIRLVPIHPADARSKWDLGNLVYPSALFPAPGAILEK